MPVIHNRMPAGIPGDVTRTAGAVLEPGMVGGADIKHGAPVKLVDGKFAPLADGDAAADLYGFLARNYPSQGGTGTLVSGVAPAGSNADVLRSGYMAVTLAAGTAVKGAAVHVRISPDGAKAVGDIEAGSATGNVAINAQFMGAADANGAVEISYNI